MTAKRSGPPAASSDGPQASRPYFPAAYGVPRHAKELLPWSHVGERMAEARTYWVCTVSPDGRPHATPVSGLWLDDRLYFSGDPATRSQRNLKDNPAVCIHLDNSMEVVILHGEVRELGAVDHARAVRLAEANNAKYGYGTKVEDYEKGRTGVWEFRPRVVFAWQDGLAAATRWELPDGT